MKCEFSTGVMGCKIVRTCLIDDQDYKEHCLIRKWELKERDLKETGKEEDKDEGV